MISQHLPTLLAMHCFQGRSNDCGPYSAAMVLRALLQPTLDPDALALAMGRVRWIGPLPFVRRIPNWATFPWGVADILREYGLAASWKVFSTPDRLLDILSRGDIPIVFIGAWRPLWGHVMVLATHNPQQGWGFVDPAWPTSDLHWLDESAFQNRWRTFARSVVVVRPEPFNHSF